MDVLTSLNPKIEGVVVTPLKQIIDLKGSVMHFIKKSDKSFSKFGEVYFSRINREIVRDGNYIKLQIKIFVFLMVKF